MKLIVFIYSILCVHGLMAQKYLQVSFAGTSTVDGRYTLSANVNSKMSWTKNNLRIKWNGFNGWVISDDGSDYYFNFSNTSVPPSTGWVKDPADPSVQLPGPTVSEAPFISITNSDCANADYMLDPASGSYTPITYNYNYNNLVSKLYWDNTLNVWVILGLPVMQYPTGAKLFVNTANTTKPPSSGWQIGDPVCTVVPTLSGDVAKPTVWQGTTNACQSIGSTSLAQNAWNNIINANGLVAQINPRSQTLSVSNSAVYANQGAIRTTSGKPYLDKNFTFNLTSQPTSAVGVRLYFSKAHFDALKAADPSISTGADLRVNRVSGGTTSCANGFTISSGQTNTVITGTVGAFGTDYYIEFETSSFSNFFISSASSALPVELTAFKGQITENGNLLTWHTASEVNTDNFDVERSTDGLQFDKIGTVKAQGKSASYEFLDKMGPLSITTYYRLKINDLDNKSSYSKVVSLSPNGKGLNAKIFPNPFRDNITIDVSTDHKTALTIDLTDILGRSIKHLSLDTEGSLNLPISTNDLSHGVYLIKISDGQTVIQQRIVKQ